MMISSDSHIIEPPDLWTRRVDREFRDRAPHVVEDPDCGGHTIWLAQLI